VDSVAMEGSTETVIDRCFSVHVLLERVEISCRIFSNFAKSSCSIYWFIRCDTQNIRLQNTANSTQLYRIPVRCKQHTFIPYTGTLQTAHSYIVYRYTANSTHLYSIQVHCKQHTFIPYTGTLQTAHSHIVYRYTANSTQLYRVPVHCKQHTFI